MKKLNYYLCSKSVVDFAQPTEVSKMFRSGYFHDESCQYFVAVIDFLKVKKHYNTLTEDEQSEFWCQECVSGTMDVSKISISAAKKTGLFVEIENKIGLTTERNRAMTIKNLSERFNCPPVEFINRLSGSE
jgi:hypothetical protein